MNHLNQRGSVAYAVVRWMMMLMGGMTTVIFHTTYAAVASQGGTNWINPSIEWNESQQTDESNVAHIIVQCTEGLGPVNHLIFGQNLEVADTGFFGPITSKAKIRTGDGIWDVQAGHVTPAMQEILGALKIGILRYPGGSMANNYDWKKSVGPQESRGDWHYGLDEYLETCKTLGALPVITVSEYLLPADQMPKYEAELVEYLNAPATLDHPWAMKRKEWGREKPYAVKWFELGNESAGGNGKCIPFRKYTPSEYASYARETASAMKAVDPTIQVGVAPVPGQDDRDPWSLEVLKRTGDFADFVVTHFYAPGMDSAIHPESATDHAKALQSCLASGDQLESYMKNFQRTVRECCGRDLPLAMTEYNVGSIGQEPQYRFSYAAGLLCADLIRIMLKPENHIEMANYWQLMNGFWGMVETYGGKTVLHSAYPLYRLWGEHFGDTLLKVDVKSPQAEFAGYKDTHPCQLQGARPESLQKEWDWQDVVKTNLPCAKNYETTLSSDGVLRITLKNFTGTAYLPCGHFILPEEIRKMGCEWHVSLEQRFLPEEGFLFQGGSKSPVKMGLGLMDNRGWATTHSGIDMSEAPTKEWHPMTKILRPLEDGSGVTLLERLEAGSEKISGTLEMKNFKLETFLKPIFPAYDLITATASFSQDKKTLYVMLFNKSIDKNIPLDIKLNGFHAENARLWLVNAPSLDSIHEAQEVLTNFPINSSEGKVRFVSPAHTMMALEITGTPDVQKALNQSTGQ